MMHYNKSIKAVLFMSMAVLLAPQSWAQFQGDSDTPAVSGNVGILWQSYSEDSLIGAVVPPAKSGYNAFANVNYSQGNFSAGDVHMALFNHVDGIRWQIWDKYMLVSIRLCISMFPWMEFDGGQIEPILPHIVK